ncbi:MAG: hypothetical protein MJZ64_03835 [Paludibacteraceae bacterium]|nr:hypothetical protein [Paludibacteraceae bacterium]
MKRLFFALFALFLMSAPTKVWGADYIYKCAPTKVTVTSQTSGYKLEIPIKVKRTNSTGSTIEERTLQIVFSSNQIDGTYTYNNSGGTLVDKTTSGTYLKDGNFYHYLYKGKSSNFKIAKRGDHVYEIQECTLYFGSSTNSYVCNLSYDANTLSNDSKAEPFVFVDRATDNNYLMKNITSVQVQYDDISNQTQLKFNVQGVNGSDTYNYETTLLLNNTAFLAGNYAVGTEGAKLDAQSKIYWPGTSSQSPATRYPLQNGTLLSIKHISGSTYQLSGALCALKDPTSSSKPYFYNFGSTGLEFTCRINYTIPDNEDKTAFLSQIKASEADFDLTLTRSLSKDYYNTFCSPVSGEVETLLGAGAEVYAFIAVSGNAEDGYTFTFSPLEGDIEAGVPYLVKPSSDDIAQIELTNVATSQLTTEAQTITTQSGFSFCGVLTPTQLSGGEYVLGDGNLLYKALPGQMKGMRAYFTFPAAQNGVAPRVALSFTNTPTDNAAPVADSEVKKYLYKNQMYIRSDKQTYLLQGIEKQ